MPLWRFVLSEHNLLYPVDSGLAAGTEKNPLLQYHSSKSPTYPLFVCTKSILALYSFKLYSG